ncbi:MAG: selenide, water dikinase SelD [Candidatus Dormibacteria bacterium]
MIETPLRLTELSRGGGCATKISQADLSRVLAGLHVPTDARLIVGPATGDDAAVYLLRDDLALIVTTDFFAPVVDDPDDYGAIAATNALSDVYAMGGAPILALNLVAWPGEDVLPPSVLAAVLAAGGEKVREAGAVVGGGHSVRDAEPKFGLAVVGTAHPDAVMTNAAGRPGDVLVLTKPLGTGVVSNALKLGEAPPDVLATAVRWMRTLNGPSAAAAAQAGVRCATDVTGFGFLGHARSLARASGCGVEIDAGALPVIEGVEALVERGLVPGGSRRNLDYANGWTAWSAGVSDFRRMLAADAQTSGGLLLAVAEDRVAGLRRMLQSDGGPAAVVGRLVAAEPGSVRVH